MYSEIDPLDAYEEGDDEASETNHSTVSSTISNASTSRLSTASTQRDEHEVRTRLSSTLLESEEFEDYTSRMSPMAARQRLLDLVNRLVPEEDVAQEGEGDRSEDDSGERLDGKRKRKEKREEPRVRTFVVGMKHGQVILESFEER